MKSKYKKIWLKALRSGHYEQGQGTLVERNKFCCLGVLVNETGGFIPFRVWSNLGGYARIFADETGVPGYSKLAVYEQNGDLPDVFLEEVGLTGVEQSKLIKLNDEQNKTFEEIADYIEDNL